MWVGGCLCGFSHQVEQWSESLGGRPLKVFATGSSLGGGVLTHICIMQPDRFAGAVLVSPMLDVKAEMRPHWIVEQVLSNVIVPLIPTWPVLPGKTAMDEGYLMHDVEAAKTMVMANQYSFGGWNLRLKVTFAY
jgi:alpha-beta hydrolase superfamily lysophospholipase